MRAGTREVHYKECTRRRDDCDGRILQVTKPSVVKTSDGGKRGAHTDSCTIHTVQVAACARCVSSRW